MLRSLRQLIERQILKARAEGKLQGLAGEGKPLPDRPEDAMVSAADSAGFRIMAQAGVLPEEIQIKKMIEAHRLYMNTLTEGAARKAAMEKLAQLELRYNIACEARRKFLK